MTTISERLFLPNQALLFDLEQLYRCLQTVPDRRKRRGRRYPLAALLMIGVLAKLAGQDSSRAISHWAKLRQHELSRLFQLKRQAMPHYSTWSRVLGQAVGPEEIEQALSQFFTGQKQSKAPKRGSIQVCLDGKTLRGTIPAGHSHGVHLMAAYLPEQGVVLMQMQVGDKTNEITTAPKVVQALDLRGVVVTGDAMQAQRELSIQIVEAQGDYVWTAKDNQPEMHEQIALLFQPQQSRPGWSAVPMDFRSATSWNKGHGRLEKRTITMSSLLASYSDFPYLAQVFRLESWAQLTAGRSRHEIRYGLSSLPASVASPERLLALVRGQWGIENGLHYRRDATLREDHSQLRMGHAPHLLAILNNTVVGLMARQGRTNLAELRREFAYQFDQALAFYEGMLALSWEFYYTSGIQRAAKNIGICFEMLNNEAKDATGVQYDQFDAMRCRFYRLSALVARERMEIDKAFDYIDEALSIASRLKNTELIASSLVGRIRIHFHKQHFEQALRDAETACSFADADLVRDPLKGKCYQMAGEAQAYLAGDDKALQDKSIAYFHKAGRIARKGNLEPDGSFVKTDLTSIYIERAKALRLFRRFDEAHDALAIARKNLSPELTRWQVNLLIEEAKTYVAQGDVTSCCTSLIDVLPIVRAIHLQNREEPIRSLLERCKNQEPHNGTVTRLEKAFTSTIPFLP